MMRARKLLPLLLILVSYLPISQTVFAATDADLEAALEELLLHHPAEIIGFKWHSIPVSKEDQQISEIYHEFGLRPIWVTANGPGKRGLAIYKALEAASDEGLDPDDYGFSEIQQRWENRSPQDLAQLDVLLSTGMVEYISDVRHGRVQPVKDDKAVYYREADKHIDPVVIINESLASEDMAKFLTDQLPSHLHYRLTRKGLKRYRELANTAETSQIPDGKTIHPGETDSRLPAIRKHLVATQDLSESSDSDNYDDTTLEAIKHYQSRHGLGVDGIIGKATIAAMNAPFDYRIRQIEMNLERLRWTDHELGDKYILVDIPGYSASTIINDEVSFEMPVIVGKHFHETPVFSETIKYVVINPYWTLTPSIARHETLPKLRKDPGYLKKKHISLFRGWSDDKEIDPWTIDWNKVTPREMNQYRLRQNPGPWNALGTLKIIFPNKHSIYMHDTPNHNLFERTERGFSHGCIRMSEPAKQAAIVLGGNSSSWTEDRIQEVVKSGKRTVVRLDNPLPVHITYQTAWGDEAGNIHFVKDIYGRDKRLEKALYGS